MNCNNDPQATNASEPELTIYCMLDEIEKHLDEQKEAIACLAANTVCISVRDEQTECDAKDERVTPKLNECLGRLDSLMATIARNNTKIDYIRQSLRIK